MIKNNVKTKDIMKEFNICKATVYQIKSEKTWSHIKLEDYLDENGNIKEVI
jgi:hypothetical protein